MHYNGFLVLTSFNMILQLALLIANDFLFLSPTTQSIAPLNVYTLHANFRAQEDETDYICKDDSIDVQRLARVSASYSCHYVLGLFHVDLKPES